MGPGVKPSRAASPHSAGAYQHDVAQSRERFLGAGGTESSVVRRTILASWRRSHELHVAADRVRLPYLDDVEFDTPLAVSAEPVLRNLGEQLEGQSVSVILTDHTGLVLRRLTGDRDLERHLDRVMLAPGFSYAEEFAGTNGIGTALEVGGPAHVFGHEHYAENLEDLACAGVPLHHPVTGRLVGAIDLTCWRRDAGGLLLTLAKATAGQIREALLAGAAASQMSVLQEYLRTCSRQSGAILAVHPEVVMLNDYARNVIDVSDQPVLLAHAAEALEGGRSRTLVVDLPSGRTARLLCRLVRTGVGPAGVVVHVRLGDVDRHDLAGGTTVPPLPGLAGAAPAWLHACHEAERLYRLGEWMVVEGEPGVGKTALLRAVQLRRQPIGRLLVVDAALAGQDPDWLTRVRGALDTADSVVVQHVDRLPTPVVRGLATALHVARVSARDRSLWAAVTLERTSSDARLLELLRLFPTTLVVPPLRLHLEDLPALVGALLSRIGQGRHLTCSPDAMRLLMRTPWPGNVEQLHQLLREVVRHRRSGVIEPGDLPPEVHSTSRRVLSPLESLERDAIVRALVVADGNKLNAARALGMSRATIYRKIHEYGVVPPGAVSE